MRLQEKVQARWDALMDAKRQFLLSAGWKEDFSGTGIFSPSNAVAVAKTFPRYRGDWWCSWFTFGVNDAIDIQKTVDLVEALRLSDKPKFESVMALLYLVKATMNEGNDGFGYLHAKDTEAASLTGIYRDLLVWAKEEGVPLVRLKPAAKILLASEGPVGVSLCVDPLTPAPAKSTAVIAPLPTE